MTAQAHDGDLAPRRAPIVAAPHTLRRAGVVVSLALFIAFTAGGYDSARGLAGAAGWVSHTERVLRELATLHRVLADVEWAHREAATSSDTSARERMRAASVEARATLATTRELVVDPAQRARLERLERAVERRLALADDLAAPDEQARQASDETEALLADLGRAESALLASRIEANEAAVQSLYLYTLGGALLGTVLFAAWFVQLERENERRRRAEAELRRERTERAAAEAQAATAFALTERAPVLLGVFAADADSFGNSRLDYANPALERYAGPGLVIGARMRGQPGAYRESVLLKQAFNVAHGAPDLSLKARPTTEGNRRVDIEIFRLPDQRAAIIVTDVTAAYQTRIELEHANAGLVSANAAIRAINAELEAFSYSVSHDLRAPLRAIHGFATALGEDYDDRLDDTGRDYLGRVRAAATRMGEIIDDLLELSRAATGALHVREVDVAVMAQSVANTLRQREPQRNVELVLHDDVRVWADPRLLRVVLENLLGNAWKFTGKTERARVEVGAEGVKVFVRDNGAGFDPRHARKLFGAFQRLHKDEFEGTGIGLATVRRVMNKHGGTVEADGAVGLGATFRLEFPRSGASTDTLTLGSQEGDAP